MFRLNYNTVLIWFGFIQFTLGFLWNSFLEANNNKDVFFLQSWLNFESNDDELVY